MVSTPDYIQQYGSFLNWKDYCVDSTYLNRFEDGTLAGYKIASVGAAAACHAMGAKKEDTNTFPTYYAWRNWIWFFLKYIPDEQLEDMSQVFLNSIFTIQYEGIYRNESNRAKTVMAALDDALHGNLGKAGEDRIFEMEHTYDPLPVILTGKKSLSISSYYMDVDENILATEEDAFMVANYDYCRNKKDGFYPHNLTKYCFLHRNKI